MTSPGNFGPGAVFVPNPASRDNRDELFIETRRTLADDVVIRRQKRDDPASGLRRSKVIARRASDFELRIGDDNSLLFGVIADRLNRFADSNLGPARRFHCPESARTCHVDVFVVASLALVAGVKIGSGGAIANQALNRQAI